jgi:hypothetical protein
VHRAATQAEPAVGIGVETAAVVGVPVRIQLGHGRRLVCRGLFVHSSGPSQLPS